ncbi:MAG: DUF2332 domain-containing protein [Propionibacteriales bacterium]|nr:DUF2332 domain-containing protein [Propionibacteriales bacterium]
MELPETLQRQAAACAALGSQMYAELLDHLVADQRAGGVSVRVLAGYEDRPFGEAIGLRLLAAVHRMVLSGTAPELAAYYPSVDGAWDAVRGWAAFEQVLQMRADEVRSLLVQPPQTNEVGRAAALYGGLLHLVEPIGLPVRLYEIGASGGLNLRADHYRYFAEGTSYGPTGSPVVFESAWTGRVPSIELRIAERVGCDIAPVDASTEAGAITLTSYVWPDMSERLARLRGALRVARRVPAGVRGEDAVSFLNGVSLAAGHITVVWHSIMCQYLSRPDRAAIEARLAELGPPATRTAPLAHLSFEPHSVPAGTDEHHRYEFRIDLQTWPDGGARTLGTATPHGRDLIWSSQ